jgi:hypothetical protein
MGFTNVFFSFILQALHNFPSSDPVEVDIQNLTNKFTSFQRGK